MKISDRYLFKTVTLATLAVLLALLVLQLLFTLIDELEDLGEGNYNLPQVMLYLALSVPRMLYQTLPPALLVGGLMGIGALSAANELVALRAAGISKLRLTFGALAAGAVLGITGLLLGEFIAPAGEQMAQRLRAEAQHGTGISQSLSERGFWARSGAQFVRVGAVLPDLTLGDITIYRLDDSSRLRSVLHAARARYQDVDQRWVLEDIRHSDISATSVASGRRVQLLWDSPIRPDTLSVLSAKPESLALRELTAYIDYLRANGLNPQQYQLAYWLKLISPLTNLAMLLIGLPFAFSRGRSSGAGQRLLIGVLLGLLFFLLNRLLSNWVLLSGLPPVIGAVVPTALFLAAGALLLSRQR